VEGVAKVLKDLVTGVSMTRDIFSSTLGKFDVKEYNPIGEKFNPDFHEALYTFEDPEKPNNSIGQVISTGYIIKDRVLRPAKVGIVKNNK
jgi:molecular chaperone GrpE